MRRNPMRTLWQTLALGALALVLGGAAGAPSGASPRELVRSLTDAVIAVLRDRGLDADGKRDRIEEIVFDHVDFETMSRLVLARHWRGLTDAQKKEFVEEFKRHLSVTYGKNVESYQNEVVSITGDRKEARNDWTVQTRIVRNGPNDILVDYRMRKIGGQWKIIDVVIERVSLVSNFRSQFQSIMTSGGIDRLLDLLRKKNQAGEPAVTS